jgi:hypothetical protein
METTPTLSEPADAIIEGYWILCEPAEVVARAIEEFTTLRSYGRPFMYGEMEISAEDFIGYLDEIVDYFRSRNLWPVETEESN